jgi:hypothetical protein
MEDHREEQDYHLKEYVEHSGHLGNSLPLKEHPQHKTGLALRQGVFFDNVLLLLLR